MTEKAFRTKDRSKASEGEDCIKDSEPSISPTLTNSFASFKHVCESRDGKLCLFEDSLGHLIAVRSSRLA